MNNSMDAHPGSLLFGCGSAALDWVVNKFFAAKHNLRMEIEPTARFNMIGFE